MVPQGLKPTLPSVPVDETVFWVDRRIATVERDIRKDIVVARAVKLEGLHPGASDQQNHVQEQFAVESPGSSGRKHSFILLVNLVHGFGLGVVIPSWLHASSGLITSKDVER